MEKEGEEKEGVVRCHYFFRGGRGGRGGVKSAGSTSTGSKGEGKEKSPPLLLALLGERERGKYKGRVRSLFRYSQSETVFPFSVRRLHYNLSPR